MNRKKEDVEIVEGSDNPFADTGFTKPAEALAKADLAHQIYNIIKSRKLTQKQAAKIMGIAQPKVSDIIRGKLSRYSIDRLMRFLRLLGRDIEIRVKKPTTRRKPAKLQVVSTNTTTRPKQKRRRVSP